MKALVLLSVTMIFLASGCQAIQVEHFESTVPYGSSVQMAVQNQILNPMPAGTEPVRGMDGRYAQSIIEKYQKGPTAEPQQSSNKESLVDVIVGGN